MRHPWSQAHCNYRNEHLACTKAKLCRIQYYRRLHPSIDDSEPYYVLRLYRSTTSINDSHLIFIVFSCDSKTGDHRTFTNNKPTSQAMPLDLSIAKILLLLMNKSTCHHWTFYWTIQFQFQVFLMIHPYLHLDLDWKTHCILLLSQLCRFEWLPSQGLSAIRLKTTSMKNLFHDLNDYRFIRKKKNQECIAFVGSIKNIWTFENAWGILSLDKFWTV